MKNSLIDGVVIDSSDIKFLPREECQLPDTKIWKVAMWGSLEDFILIEKLQQSFSKLSSYLSDHKIKKGVGFQLLTQKKDKKLPDELLLSLKYLDANLIEPYYTTKSNLQKVNASIKTAKAKKFYLEHYKKVSLHDLPVIEIFRRLGTKSAYKEPHFIIKKGTENGFTCASFLDYSCSFRDGVYGFYAEKKKERNLKIIVSYINSVVSNYFLFLSISSYGIEREQIMLKEFLGLPFPELNPEIEEKIISKLDEFIQKKKELDVFSDRYVGEEIDQLFMDALGLSVNDQYLIKDALELNIDLFLKGKDSRALRSIVIDETRLYAKLITESLSTFLNNSSNISIKIFDTPRNIPLNLVVIKFNTPKNDLVEGNLSEIAEHLLFLDKMTLQKEAQSIYIKKVIKYFDGNTIYLIKPNQKRFWSRSMALNDARDLITDILKM